MSQVSFKRGKATKLNNLEMSDGQFIVTVDEGRIYLDYTNEDGELVRKALYSGVLHIGEYDYDGTQDVTVPSYDGEEIIKP